MAMPKKGTRKIVVDGEAYLYRIRVKFRHGYYGYKTSSVTIQFPDGKILVDKKEMLEITPGYIRKLILLEKHRGKQK